MNALLNGTAITSEDLSTLSNRAFRFGDGCFETMLAYEGVCALLVQHLARLKKSLSVLGLEPPKGLQLQEQIMQLCPPGSGWQRLRLWVWRAGEGVYAPTGSKSHFLLATSPTAAPVLEHRSNVLFSEDVVLMPSRWSFIKSLSALPYVMAGKEKAEKSADELILLNHRGEVTEASSANLFWKKRKRWYTPALDCGGIAGAMRSWLMQKLLEKGEPAFEVIAQAAELEKVDKLVCTNVAGLYPVEALNDKRYNTDIEELWALLPVDYKDAQ